MNSRKRFFCINSLIKNLSEKKEFKNYDFGIFLGDFNFRTQFELEDIKYMLNQKKFKLKNLKNFDEFLCMKKKKHLFQKQENFMKENIFQKLNEMEIFFPPTYKLFKNKNVFQISKKRLPSYTDRILFIVEDKELVFEPINYASCFNTMGSDHKPVFSQFEIVFNSSN